MPTPRVWDAVQAVSMDDESRHIPWLVMRRLYSLPPARPQDARLSLPACPMCCHAWGMSP
jgi:hypothetical protein